jgi:hypothetical protein
MKIKYIAALLLSVGILAGCGGGSSSSSGPAPHPTATIDSTNASTVTKAALDAASQSLGGNLVSTGAPAPGSSVSPAAVQTATASKNDRVLYNLADLAVKIVNEQKNLPASVTGVTATYPCTVGGDYTYASDGNTSSSITYNNCSYAAGTSLNGSYSMSGVTYTTAIVNGITTLTSFAADVAFNVTILSTGNPTLKLVGGYNFALSGLDTTLLNFRLRGSSIVVSVDSLSDSLTNFDFQSSLDTTSFATSDLVKYTASSDFLKASFSFDTLLPIVRNSGDIYPRSGKFMIYGANASALRATVVDTDVNAGTASGTIALEICTNTTIGSMGACGAPITRTWTQIRAGT